MDGHGGGRVHAGRVAVLLDAGLETQCRKLAKRLAAPLLETVVEPEGVPYVLRYTDRGLVLQQTGRAAPGPVIVDFASGPAVYRRRKGGGELIVKAVGGNRQRRPAVVDATAGLGRDSFVLASWGYPVTLCERSGVVAALLEDGLLRAVDSGDTDLSAIAGRMCLHPVDAGDYLASLPAAQWPDVVLMDPMFPESRKSALVKKDMRAFHDLIGDDRDSDALLRVALSVARHRVIVKRPKKAPFLADRKPSFSVSGKAIRFDIYAIRAFAKS